MTVGRDAQGGGSVKRRVGGGSKQNVLPMGVKQSKPYVIHKNKEDCLESLHKCI